MRQFLWYFIFAASLFIGYQGYVNAQNFRETQGDARNAVCKAIGQTPEACELKGDAEPNGHSTGVTGRTYQFQTKGGPFLAECKREYTFFGTWSCTARAGSLM
ncbi:hypothetical protein [Nannocystis bainbridge]|uniref:Uncharacterized protein n=1 Tax=Nannocystis bainbridge TaxID=2995303 RepID=A0ABT5E4U5_9BACT|nr:hypothetical protein [Nannocystis bainbridge]MDC0720750.1 hypothetical protein [Nannocystis bainbridge]